MKKILIVVFALLLLPTNTWADDKISNKSNFKIKVKKQFIVDCLAGANQKGRYKLYDECIGKFTDACISDYIKYESLFEESSTGRDYMDCAGQEEEWWNEIYKQYSKKLITIEKDKKDNSDIADYKKSGWNFKNVSDIPSTLTKALNSLNLIGNKCEYEGRRWGPIPGPATQAIRDATYCGMTTSAEKAITVYLWYFKR